MRQGGGETGVQWPFAPLRAGHYDIVLADPPWRFDVWSDKGLQKSPQAHYACMGFDDIAALPVGDLVARRGVLIMWCTWPLLDRQIGLLAGWGLQHLTGGVWAKRTSGGRLAWGPGYVQRTVCEPYIIAARADCGGRSNIKGRRMPNLVETLADAMGEASVDGLRREHSRKPDEFYALLDTLTGWTRRAELFARQRRPGWKVWGNQTDRFRAARQGAA